MSFMHHGFFTKTNEHLTIIILKFGKWLLYEVKVLSKKVLKGVHAVAQFVITFFSILYNITVSEWFPWLRSLTARDTPNTLCEPTL